MKPVIGTLVMAVLVTAAAAPARGEHMTLMSPATEAPGAPVVPDTAPSASRMPSVDLDLALGPDGFRLGARFFSALGMYGAWLNGRTRPDGFSLDGRVQDPDGAYSFRMNADVNAWPRRLRDGLLSP
jgi:hypothetical protein